MAFRTSWLSSRPELRAVLWMTLASALFAGMNVGARLASGGLPWPEIAASRAITGAVLAAMLSRLRGSSLRVRDRKRSWMRSLFGTAAMLCTFFVLSAREVPLGDVVTLGATSPVFIALLSPSLLGESVGRRVWTATPIAFIGVALVAQPTFHASMGVVLVASLASVFSAFAMLSLRRLGSDESSEAIVFHFSATAAVATLSLSLLNPRVPSALSLGALALTGLCGGFAQLAMTRAYALDRAARLGALGYLGIVFTQVCSILWLGERPSPAQAGGSLLVIVAGVVLALGAMRDARAAAASDSAPSSSPHSTT